MSFIGKLHEIAFYALITVIGCSIKGVVNPKTLLITVIVYLIIAIIGAFSTKYADEGEGLSFFSDNIIVIMFAHIAEELLGIICTPFWFLRDLFTKELTFIKLVDYVTFTIEVLIAIACLL
jgi:hypothetical protein